jgi:CRP-like cAMP-binding protein
LQLGPADRGYSLSTFEFKNSRLKTLGPTIVARLHLRPIEFRLGHEIQVSGTSERDLYFVEEGMASIMTTFADGSEVETGMFGREAIIGLSSLMGSKQNLHRVYTQIAGSGYCCTLEAARQEFLLCGLFQAVTLQCVQSQLVEAMQSAGCNTKHTVQERLARRLLNCGYRTGSNSFNMSHAVLADMLGARRSTISVEAKRLKDLKLINYSRGTIELLDVEALESLACECYRAVKNHLDF